MTTRLRDATADDVPVLMAMMVDFNRGESIEWRPEPMERALRILLADPLLGLVVIVRDRDAEVGYAILTWGFDLEWVGRDAFLTELYLVPAARGRGLGGEVMEALEARALAAGANALHMMVRHDNARAIRLYRGHGYVSPDRHFLSKRLR